MNKLKITPLKRQGRQFVPDTSRQVVEALFNPTSYSITKTVSWNPVGSTSARQSTTQRSTNAPILNFGGGGSRQLSLELFFDVTETSGFVPINLIFNDVRQETDKVVALTRIGSDQSPPPVCEVAWGKTTTKDFPFIGVITNLVQRFTLFAPDGTPLRANLTVAFTEFRDPQDDLRETDPELTTHVVKRSETLSGIAGELYHDPAAWRIIAEANQMDDPRRLTPGQVLKIPKQS